MPANIPSINDNGIIIANTDRVAEVSHGGVSKPAAVSLHHRVAIAVFLQPDLSGLLGGVGSQYLGCNAVDVDFQQQEQKDRHHDHGENHEAEPLRDENEHESGSSMPDPIGNFRARQ
jgi:hypothetical protein